MDEEEEKLDEPQDDGFAFALPDEDEGGDGDDFGGDADDSEEDVEGEEYI